MWAVANGLRKAGITSFNGKQVTGGANWRKEWFGVLADPGCVVVVPMLSKLYFESSACIQELEEACTMDNKLILPIFLEEVDLSGYFLGDGTRQRKLANFLRMCIERVNCIPEPEQGFFQGANGAEFEVNMCTLVTTLLSEDFLGEV